jgi:single-stranded-DNA-specific exonuclease
LDVDAELDFRRIDFSLVREIAALQPFGIGNPEPVFMTRGVEIAERREVNGGARLRLRQADRSLAAVGFRGALGAPAGAEPVGKLGVRSDPLTPGAKIDIVYRLTENKWDGTFAVELRIADVKTST